MVRPSRLVAVAVTILTITATSGVARAAPALTYQQIAAMPPADQAAILDPLRAVASTAGAVGRAQGANVLAGIQIDAPSHTVSIYLTDLKQQPSFQAAMQETAKGVDLSPARFKQGLYTIAEMKTAAQKLITQKQPGLSVESVALAPDGSSLQVRAFNVAQTRQTLAGLASAIGSIPTVVEQVAEDITDLSRTRDTPDWISGAALTWTGTPSNYWYDCTMGLPTRSTYDGQPFLTTAAHCYPDGATVYTGVSGGGRNYVGYVVGRDNWNDAIAIYTGDTGWTASQEWDGPGENGAGQHVYDVTEDADYSYVGDMTCQDGFSIGIRCGLLVTSGFAYWEAPESGIPHVGVEARQVDDHLAGDPGDSGGLVFSLINRDGGTARQPRGSVSMRYDWVNLRWTEAPAILSYFGLYMAPG